MRQTPIRDELLAFNELELRAKALFEAHRGRATDPVALLLQVLPDVVSHDRVGEGRRPEPGSRIPEAAFLRGDADVAVVKHIRYLPVVAHTHEFIELSYVYEGAGEHSIMGGAVFQMERGDVTLVPPGLGHAVGVFDDGSIVINILVRRSTFDRAFFELITVGDVLADFFTRLIYGPVEHHTCIRFRTGDSDRVRRLLEDIYAEAEDSRPYRTRMLNLLVMQLCTTLIGDHETDIAVLGSAEAAGDPRTYQALRYLVANFRNVSLGDLANRFGYSESHLSRIIKATTGRTFSSIVRELRARRAVELLTNPTIPLEQVVEGAGYSDLSHFYRSFRRDHGMTPAEYRRRLRNGRSVE